MATWPLVTDPHQGTNGHCHLGSFEESLTKCVCDSVEQSRAAHERYMFKDAVKSGPLHVVPVNTEQLLLTLIGANAGDLVLKI